MSFSVNQNQGYPRVRSDSTNSSVSDPIFEDDNSLVSAATDHSLGSQSVDSSTSAASPSLAPGRFVVRTGSKPHDFSYNRQELIKQRFEDLGLALTQAHGIKKLNPDRFAIVFQPGKEAKDRSVRLVQKDKHGKLTTILPSKEFLELINNVDNTFVKDAYEALIEEVIESDTNETVEGKLAKEEKELPGNKNAKNITVKMQSDKEKFTVNRDGEQYPLHLSGDQKEERDDLIRGHALYPFHEYLGKPKREPEVIIGLIGDGVSDTSSIHSIPPSEGGDDSSITTERGSIISKDGSYRGPGSMRKTLSPVESYSSYTPTCYDSKEDNSDNVSEISMEGDEDSVDREAILQEKEEKLLNAHSQYISAIKVGSDQHTINRKEKFQIAFDKYETAFKEMDISNGNERDDEKFYTELSNVEITGRKHPTKSAADRKNSNSGIDYSSLNVGSNRKEPIEAVEIETSTASKVSFPPVTKQSVEIDVDAESEFRKGLDLILESEDRVPAGGKRKKESRKKGENSAPTVTSVSTISLTSHNHPKTFKSSESGDALDELVGFNAEEKGQVNDTISPFSVPSTLATTDSPQESSSEDDDKIIETPEPMESENQSAPWLFELETNLQSAWNVLEESILNYRAAIERKDSAEISKQKKAYTIARYSFYGFWEGGEEVETQMNQLTDTADWKERLNSLRNVEDEFKKANREKLRQKAEIEAAQMWEMTKKTVEVGAAVKAAHALSLQNPSEEAKLISAWTQLNEVVEQYTILVDRYIKSKNREELKASMQALGKKYQSAFGDFKSLWTDDVDVAREQNTEWTRRLKDLNAKIARLELALNAEMPEPISRPKSTDNLPRQTVQDTRRFGSVPPVKTRPFAFSSAAIKKAEEAVESSWKVVDGALDNYTAAVVAYNAASKSERQNQELATNVPAKEKEYEMAKEVFSNLWTQGVDEKLRNDPIWMAREEQSLAKLEQLKNLLSTKQLKERTNSPISRRSSATLLEAAKKFRQHLISGQEEAPVLKGNPKAAPWTHLNDAELEAQNYARRASELASIPVDREELKQTTKNRSLTGTDLQMAMANIAPSSLTDRKSRSKTPRPGSVRRRKVKKANEVPGYTKDTEASKSRSTTPRPPSPKFIPALKAGVYKPNG